MRQGQQEEIEGDEFGGRLLLLLELLFVFLCMSMFVLLLLFFLFWVSSRSTMESFLVGTGSPAPPSPPLPESIARPLLLLRPLLSSTLGMWSGGVAAVNDVVVVVVVVAKLDGFAVEFGGESPRRDNIVHSCNIAWVLVLVQLPSEAAPWSSLSPSSSLSSSSSSAQTAISTSPPPFSPPPSFATLFSLSLCRGGGAVTSFSSSSSSSRVTLGNEDCEVQDKTAHDDIRAEGKETLGIELSRFSSVTSLFSCRFGCCCSFRCSCCFVLSSSMSTSTSFPSRESLGKDDMDDHDNNAHEDDRVRKSRFGSPIVPCCGGISWSCLLLVVRFAEACCWVLWLFGLV